MAAKLTLIILTTALPLLSGCLDGADRADATADAYGPEADGTAAPSTPPGPAPVAPCPTNLSNYGVALTFGDTYVFTGRGGNLLVVYQESNGIGGLQTEEDCAGADTKVAEVPLLPAGRAALNA